MVDDDGQDDVKVAKALRRSIRERRADISKFLKITGGTINTDAEVRLL